jgi:hypothetical protein
MRPSLQKRKHTAEKGDLDDVPGVSQTPYGNVAVIGAGCMLRVEEERHGARVSAETDMAVAIAMTEGVIESRRATAIEERAILVGCMVVRLGRH